MAYPASFDSLRTDLVGTDYADDVDHAGLHNAVDASVMAVQAELGLNPSGGAATVTARLTDMDATVDTLAAGIGNLLTANQAKPTSTGAYVVFNATEGAAGVFTLTSGEAIARALDIPVTGGATYTLIATATVPDRYVRTMVLWKDSGGNAIGSIAGSGNPYDFPVSGSGTVTITLVAPANAVTADFYPFYTSAGAGGDSLTVTRASFHRGAGGTWQMPGVPIPGQSRIAVNNAVDLSGTGAPEGVIAAAPGSTYLQTDATNDVKGWIKWVKATGTGSTGWVAGPEADTGWRDVSASLDSTFKTKRPNALVHLRRRGDICEVRFIDSGTPQAVGGLIYELPDGFWGNSSTKAATVMLNADTVAGTTASMLITYAAGQWLYCAGWSTVPYVGSLAWMTTRGWPTALPGSAA